MIVGGFFKDIQDSKIYYLILSIGSYFLLSKTNDISLLERGGEGGLSF